MKTLQINQNYRISSDTICLTVEQRRVGQKGKSAGKERWLPVAYCSNIERAFEVLGDQIILDEWPDLSKIQSLISEVRDILKPLKQL